MECGYAPTPRGSPPNPRSPNTGAASHNGQKGSESGSRSQNLDAAAGAGLLRVGWLQRGVCGYVPTPRWSAPCRDPPIAAQPFTAAGRVLSFRAQNLDGAAGADRLRGDNYYNSVRSEVLPPQARPGHPATPCGPKAKISVKLLILLFPVILSGVGSPAGSSRTVPPPWGAKEGMTPRTW